MWHDMDEGPAEDVNDDTVENGISSILSNALKTTYYKSHPEVSETGLREAIKRELQLETNINYYWHWKAQLIDAIVTTLQHGYIEHEKLHEHYALYFCRNCGKAHDQDKCQVW